MHEWKSAFTHKLFIIFCLLTELNWVRCFQPLSIINSHKISILLCHNDIMILFSWQMDVFLCFLNGKINSVCQTDSLYKYRCMAFCGEIHLELWGKNLPREIIQDGSRHRRPSLCYYTEKKTEPKILPLVVYLHNFDLVIQS